MSLAGVIAVQRAEHGIPHAVSCRALGVSQAWFYKWRNGDRSPRHRRRPELASRPCLHRNINPKCRPTLCDWRLVQRVHKFYEQLGREDVRAVQEADEAEQKTPEAETKK